MKHRTHAVDLVDRADVLVAELDDVVKRLTALLVGEEVEHDEHPEPE